MLVAGIVAQKYAAIFLFALLWCGIALAARGLLRWLAEQERDSLGF